MMTETLSVEHIRQIDREHDCECADCRLVYEQAKRVPVLEAENATIRRELEAARDVVEALRAERAAEERSASNTDWRVDEQLSDAWGEAEAVTDDALDRYDAVLRELGRPARDHGDEETATR